MAMTHDDSLRDLISVSEAARMLGRSSDQVRAYADAGRIPVIRTRSGQRLFKASDVERLISQRNPAGRR